MKKKLLVLLIAIMVVAACGPASTPTEEAPPTSPPAVEPTTPPEDVSEPTQAPVEEPTKEAEPKRVTLGTAFWLAGNWAPEGDDGYFMKGVGMYDTLLDVDSEGVLGPSLAVSWQQTDETTWEFKLRSGVSFQNGEPFNADAVVIAFNYLRNSLQPLPGFSPDAIASIEALGDDIVIFRTTEPDMIFPTRLAAERMGILAPSAFMEDGSIDPFGKGSGPFILTEEVPDQSITLVGNDNYWRGTVNIDEVVVLWVPDGTTRATMLQTGEIDIASGPPIPQIPILEADPDITVISEHAPRTQTLYMNNRSGPMSDILVRQAIQHAFDKQLLVDTVLEGNGVPAVGPFPPFEGWANLDLQGYAYDPERAKELLAEAGYEEGELSLTLMTYPGRAEFPPMVVAMQAMLGDVGINVSIRIEPYSNVERDALAGDYDLFMLSRGHLKDAYDPGGMIFNDYHCDGYFNLSLYCSETFDELYDEASVTNDAEGRFEIYKRLQSILIDEEAVSVWINHYVAFTAIRNHLLNYAPTLYGGLQWDLDISQ